MPRKRLKLPPIVYQESVGQRLARIRKERGYTQVELAKKIGTIQGLISDYKNDNLRLSADMAVRFALALDVSTDELLHPGRAVDDASDELIGLVIQAAPIGFLQDLGEAQDLSQRLPIVGSDEFTMLTETLNHMLERLDTLDYTAASDGLIVQL